MSTLIHIDKATPMAKLQDMLSVRVKSPTFDKIVLKLFSEHGINSSIMGITPLNAGKAVELLVKLEKNEINYKVGR